MREAIIEGPLAAEIAALLAMSEDTIDTTDIPAAQEENWRGAKRAYRRTRHKPNGLFAVFSPSLTPQAPSRKYRSLRRNPYRALHRHDPARLMRRRGRRGPPST